MTNINKILIALVIVLTIFMVGATYQRIFVRNDYIIKMAVDCNPQSETCLAKPADNGGETVYYKTLEQKAYDLR